MVEGGASFTSTTTKSYSIHCHGGNNPGRGKFHENFEPVQMTPAAREQMHGGGQLGSDRQQLAPLLLPVVQQLPFCIFPQNIVKEKKIPSSKPHAQQAMVNEVLEEQVLGLIENPILLNMV